MESGSQGPARFNIVNFPGKLEQNKNKQTKKKVNHSSVGEGEQAEMCC